MSLTRVGEQHFIRIIYYYHYYWQWYYLIFKGTSFKLKQQQQKERIHHEKTQNHCKSIWKYFFQNKKPLTPPSPTPPICKLLHLMVVNTGTHSLPHGGGSGGVVALRVLCLHVTDDQRVQSLCMARGCCVQLVLKQTGEVAVAAVVFHGSQQNLKDWKMEFSKLPHPNPTHSTTPNKLACKLTHLEGLNDLEESHLDIL